MISTFIKCSILLEKYHTKLILLIKKNNFTLFFFCSEVDFAPKSCFKAYANTERSVRQGFVFLPDLFNFYSEVIIRELENSTRIYYCCEKSYQYDTVLVTVKEEELQELLKVLKIKEGEGKQLKRQNVWLSAAGHQ